MGSHSVPYLSVFSQLYVYKLCRFKSITSTKIVKRVTHTYTVFLNLLFLYPTLQNKKYFWFQIKLWYIACKCQKSIPNQGLPASKLWQTNRRTNIVVSLNGFLFTFMLNYINYFDIYISSFSTNSIPKIEKIWNIETALSYSYLFLHVCLLLYIYMNSSNILI